jgi:tetratricopeptide (TPR) repeat protein
VEGETLWEFLHHRDDMLQDENGKTLIPLLIFDQFEEVFTVAQSDEFGRARAARFIADLADLVENRPPASFEAKLEADDTLAEKFDFARSDYRVLLSLREDYLAPLEGLKADMPSVTQNRLRLAPMNGRQGLDAVLRPGKKLVSPEVAEAIVRFVAGNAEIANAEVEPSLLSLICRELNDTRISQGRAEISLDLLAGSHATILSNFYERALADQPAAIRRVIEDELLTESGFRENIAEERLQKSFTAAGAAPDTLGTLVNRRLLRIEERLDVRRVELTHDVLCGVVKSSRDVRLEREQREAAEKSLAEQKERAQRTRSALIRARQIATVCIVLAVGAAGAAVFAYFSLQRAQRAEGAAQSSRVQAEQLLGFLTEDFGRELQSSGRVEVVAGLAEREVEYFHKLPAELRGPTTVRMGAMALQQLASASRSVGKIKEARAAAEESIALLTQLQKGGDNSEATIIGLARSTGTLASVMASEGAAEDLATGERALALLMPLAAKPDASIAVREAEAEAYNRLGYLQQFQPDATPALATLDKAMEIAARYGALDTTNIRMSESYIDAASWLVQTAAFQGEHAKAEKAGAEGIAVAEKLRALRPGNKLVIYSQAVIETNLAGVALDKLRPAEAMPKALRSRDLQQTLVSMDPANTVAHNNLAAAGSGLADSYWSLGRVRESTAALEQAMGSMRVAAKGSPSLQFNAVQYLFAIARRRAESGDLDAIPKIVAEMEERKADLQARAPEGTELPERAAGIIAGVSMHVAFVRGNPGEALRQARAQLTEYEKLKNEGSGRFGRYYSNDQAALAAFQLGNFAAAEAHARAALDLRRKIGEGSNFDFFDLDLARTKLALILLAQQRNADAAKIMTPVLKRRREVEARNHGDCDTKFALATARYVQALLEAPQREELLNEAATIISNLPREYRNLFSTRYVLDLISDAQIGRYPWTGKTR